MLKAIVHKIKAKLTFLLFDLRLVESYEIDDRHLKVKVVWNLRKLKIKLGSLLYNLRLVKFYEINDKNHTVTLHFGWRKVPVTRR